MATRIEELAAVLESAPGGVFIQPHDVPDPDAIASAFALRYLLSRSGIEARVVYDREYDKIDTRRMVELLGIDLSLASEVASLDEEDWIVVVDGQSGNANIVDLGCVAVAAIDHHEPRSDASYRYSDIRPDAGSCSSIVAEYFFEAGEPLPRLVATALVYGMFVDTDNLTRGVSELDALMFYRLRAFSDAELIRRLRGSQITLRDLSIYADAFRTVETYGRLGFLRLEDADDSLIGAANDIVLSLDEVDASVAFSIRPEGVKISARSLSGGIRADDLARAVVSGLGFGGGHAHMAGGFIPAEALPPGKPVAMLVKHRAISYLEGLGG
ncbi:MAG: DHH family phosphoesterase [Spirochaetes bacterium]|nr:DHH family phosphoesterase [Spirochaetota bacterium]MBU1080166.1 DHH family phosphoesterase [Spirochaetota bacterium]